MQCFLLCSVVFFDNSHRCLLAVAFDILVGEAGSSVSIALLKSVICDRPEINSGVLLTERLR